MNNEKEEKTLILASASQARKQILEQAGFSVIVRPTGAFEGSSIKHPGERAEILSQHKLETFIVKYPELKNLNFHIITADTVISCQESIFGKPSSRNDARNMLIQFSGSVHSVFTGYSIMFPHTGEIVSGWESSDVTFFNLGSNEIEKYLNAGEWYGAAGSYRVQGTGLRMISSIKGSYFTVAGLPIHKISGILRERGF
ncbi:MAG: septum formation protein Maf [Spirochaetales bacterium]|nr:septum formation protein Maf [Spirochaetales bacterium]